MQLTLLYHPGKTFYRLALRYLMAHCASRINHNVTKSPTVVLTWVHDQIMEPSPSPSETIHMGSPTITHSQYLRQSIDFKHKSTLVIMTYKSETNKYLDDMTGEVYQLCNVNAKTLITNACQQNNTIITEKLVSNRNC